MIPSARRPGETDLGVWNIFANPDFPGPQKKLRRLLCREQRQALLQTPQAGWCHRHPCSESALLERSIASFRTPGLCDPGHLAPYMHNGQLVTLEAVAGFYINVSEQAREGRFRNPA